MNDPAIDLVLAARPRSIGAAMVDRVLPAIQRRHVGPYIFLDHLGPARGAFGIAAHPHIGLSTLTYLYSGAFIHHDSLGNTVPIRPGEVNWMTAGRGIAHSERVPADSAGEVHSLQLWVGLTEAHEETAPFFQHLDADQVPGFSDPGVAGRLIAGAAYGLESPLRTFTPQCCLDVRLAQDASLPLPREHEERAVYVVAGRVRVGAAGCAPRHMLVFRPGGEPVITADEDSTILLLGGAPIAGPHMWWNFVSSRRDRIEQAKRDWSEGRFVLPPDDDREWIPLPQTARPPGSEDG